MEEQQQQMDILLSANDYVWYSRMMIDVLQCCFPATSSQLMTQPLNKATDLCHYSRTDVAGGPR